MHEIRAAVSVGEGQMTLITTLMRVHLHLATLRTPLRRATMQTLRHHKDRTTLKPPAVHTHLTRATLVLHLFPTRVSRTLCHLTLFYYFFE